MIQSYRFQPTELLYCSDDCWLLSLNSNGTAISWNEVDLPYDHGSPRCGHAACVMYEGEIFIHSGLTQPYYITIEMLIVNQFYN